MQQVQLTKSVAEKLLAQDPTTERNGGFQRLVIKLRRQYEPKSGLLTVSPTDLEKVDRYATKYGGGGWQSMLTEIRTKASKT